MFFSRNLIGAFIFAVCIGLYQHFPAYFFWAPAAVILIWIFLGISYHQYKLSRAKYYYKAVEIASDFSKAEILLRLSNLCGIDYANNMLLIKYADVTIEFFEENKMRIMGDEARVEKFCQMFANKVVVWKND